jgi:hypothetical protein
MLATQENTKKEYGLEDNHCDKKPAAERVRQPVLGGVMEKLDEQDLAITKDWLKDFLSILNNKLFQWRIKKGKELGK